MQSSKKGSAINAKDRNADYLNIDTGAKLQQISAIHISDKKYKL